MNRQRITRLLSLAALLGLVAACDTTTGPEDQATFDADAALADYQAMDDILSTNVMAGFRAMGGGVSIESLGPVPDLVMGAVADLTLPTDPEEAQAFAHGMVRLAGSLPEASRAPIISEFNRGKVFAYDPDLGRYAHDPDRTDGPTNGIRWVLYEDDGTGKPDPNQEIGHVDLLDLGDGSPEDISLALVAEVDGTVRLDYQTTLDVLENGGRITVLGFIRGEDAADRLDFDIDVEGSDAGDQGTMDISFEMRVDSRDFRITGDLTGVDDGGNGSGTIELSVRHGSESLRISATGSDTNIDGTFYLNDEVFATVFGDPDDPTIESASGEPLTLQEALVLHHMVDVVEDIFDLFEDLLDPIDELVLLALIL